MSPLSSLERYRRLQTVLVVMGIILLALSIALIAGAIHERNARREDTRAARVVVCEQINGLKALARRSLSGRIVTTERFLDKHPNGIPGISAALLRQSLVRLRNERDANAPTDCKEFANNPQEFRQ